MQIYYYYIYNIKNQIVIKIKINKNNNLLKFLNLNEHIITDFTIKKFRYYKVS